MDEPEGRDFPRNIIMLFKNKNKNIIYITTHNFLVVNLVEQVSENLLSTAYLSRVGNLPPRLCPAF